MIVSLYKARVARIFIDVLCVCIFIASYSIIHIKSFHNRIVYWAGRPPINAECATANG